MILTLRLKEMTAATVGPKLDTGYKGAAGDSNRDKELDSRKSKLLAAGYEDKDDK